MEYEVIRGKKLNSKLLYSTSEKHLYKIKSKRGNKIYYTCYFKNCPVRVCLNNEILSKVSNNKQHKHESGEALFKEISCINKIRDDCKATASVMGTVNAIGGIRTAFKRAIESNVEGSSCLNYDTMKRGLQRITNKVFQKSPKTATEINQAFEKSNIFNEFGVSKNSEKFSFFKACIEDGLTSYCIFSSEKIINMIKEHVPLDKRQYLLDGTFKIVPQGSFKQLLIIYINYLDIKVYPFMFVLMSKRTKECYVHLFKYINEHIFKLEPKGFLTDYEIALRSGLKEVYPYATLQGCWFHYCQAIRRNIITKHKNLAELIRSRSPASIIFHKFLAMALLPTYCIDAAFITLKTEAQEAFGDNFDSFLNYYDKYWLKSVGAKNFSVFMKITRTTSDVEGYNGVLGRMLNKNGNFYKFVKVLQDEELLKSRDFAILVESGGIIGGKKRKKVDLNRHSKILEGFYEIEDGTITAQTFLRRMVYSKNNICTDLEPFDELFEEFVDNEDNDTEELGQYQDTLEQTINNALCIICYCVEPNIVLLPCKHMQICEGCDSKVKRNTSDSSGVYSCPTCRVQVETSLKVFTY